MNRYEFRFYTLSIIVKIPRKDFNPRPIKNTINKFNYFIACVRHILFTCDGTWHLKTCIWHLLLHWVSPRSYTELGKPKVNNILDVIVFSKLNFVFLLFGFRHVFAFLFHEETFFENLCEWSFIRVLFSIGYVLRRPIYILYVKVRNNFHPVIEDLFKDYFFLVKIIEIGIEGFFFSYWRISPFAEYVMKFSSDLFS